MKAFAIDYHQNTLRAFTSRRVAQSMGNGLVVFTSAEELAENRNTTLQGIVSVFNNYARNINSGVVKRFSDIKTGAKRVMKVAESLPVEETPFEHLNGEKTMTEETLIHPDQFNNKAQKADVEVHVKSANKPKKRGRNSGYEGKMIKCLVEKNPRRQNTHGFHSMGILINAGEPVSYESYIAQGGRRQDLAWDIDKGYAEISE